MTQKKKLKERVRERMAKTGERYAAARRHVIAAAPEGHGHDQPYLHLPGSNPGSSSLRIALANAGLRSAGSGKTLSEAMVFGIAGGIGAGVFAFRYQKEDISTFFIAGRHQWEDEQAYLQTALDRLGCRYQVSETGSANKAAANLEQALDQFGPAIAWVDMAHLPYRRMPEYWSGGGYHVLVVYRFDPDGEAVVGDLADQPLHLSAQALEQARARIKKQKNRVLSIREAPAAVELRPAIVSGLQATVDAFENPRQSSFSLHAFSKWAADLKSSGKDGWQQKFPPGHNLWRGLTSIYDFVEHYGTGGGLCRPLYAEFLREAAETLDHALLSAAASRYDALGAQWSALAESALPSDVPAFAEARSMLDEKAAAFLSDGDASAEKADSAWDRLMALEAEANAAFPLGPEEIERLLQQLGESVAALYKAETAALESVQEALEKLTE